MAGPEVAIISMGMQAASGAMGAFGAASAGAAKASQMRYQAGVARVNQQIAKQNAAYASAVGEFEATVSGRKTRHQVGQTKVIQSGRGLDVNTGSNADVVDSQIEIGQQNQAIIRANAARKAFGYETEAFNKGVEADLLTRGAKDTETGSILDAAGSILGTGASVASKWMTYKQNFPDTAGSAFAGAP